jgi:hypothetical protein
LIAHPNPGVRLRLAMEVIDDHPVFMTNGTRALVRQLEAVRDGVVRAPRALILGERQLAELADEPVWDALTPLRLTVVLITTADGLISIVDAVLEEAPRPVRVRELLAA